MKEHHHYIVIVIGSLHAKLAQNQSRTPVVLDINKPKIISIYVIRIYNYNYNNTNIL